MITKEQALQIVENLDDYTRMANIDPMLQIPLLKEYIEKISELGDMHYLGE